MKAKIRRLEEDNLKKEKEIDSLLHPHKVNQILIWYSKLPYAFTRVNTCKGTWSTVVLKFLFMKFLVLCENLGRVSIDFVI